MPVLQNNPKFESSRASDRIYTYDLRNRTFPEKAHIGHFSKNQSKTYQIEKSETTETATGFKMEFTIKSRQPVYPLGYVDGFGLYNGYFAQWMILDPLGLETVCCKGKKYKKNRRKKCCGTHYIQTGNNAPCCVGGVPKKRIKRHVKNGTSLDACIADNTKFTTLTGLIMGTGAQAAGSATKAAGKAANKMAKVVLTQIGTKSNAIGWVVTGISLADYAQARTYCERKVCP
jgi:hypothetical protein